jgi:Ca2+-binding EF-hand superfamily protein
VSMKKAGKERHDRAVERFKSADKDNDGTLTKDEAKAMPRVAKNFDAIDADKDGTVSEKEIHSYMKAQHQKK